MKSLLSTVTKYLSSTSSHQQEEEHPSEPAGGPDAPPVYDHHLLHHPPSAAPSQIPLTPPCFLQKLKSQEVAEGSPIRLECRVTGTPPPLVR
ncbi:Palladin [Dissostichus eleginoides]|uniref:Palladin n=1 Tax=Dissostichus eleginoides TaxID=100907 RepID=A0AAD9C5Z2_DISEL|nr:Palladin [Dissostichus eleginoides]